jgi:putative ABC transport system permease protein
MILSYFKSAYRAILANKIFSAIHIIGLSIGLAACFIMLMIVIHEYSYDKHNEFADDTYRAYSYTPLSDRNWYTSPFPLGDFIKTNIPEAQKVARSLRLPINAKIEGSDDKLDFRVAHSVDPEIFDILTIPISKGNPSEVFTNINSILISEKIAEKYFNGSNPLGQKIEIKIKYLKGSDLFNVVGVFEDLPFTSTYKPNIILPIYYAKKHINARYSYRGANTADGWSPIHLLDTYILLNNKANYKSVEQALPSQIQKDKNSNSDMIYKLQNLKEIHLNEDFANWNPVYVNAEMLRIFSGISLVILLIACLNFIAMSITRLNEKAKQIGIRKTIGAGKANVLALIVTESLVYSIISFPITIGFIELFSGYVSEHLNVKLGFGFSTQLNTIGLFFLLTLSVGILSAFYSVVKLHKLSPVETIFYKSSLNNRSVKSTPAVLVFQLVTLIGVVFISLIVKNQTDFFKEIDLGFETKNIMIVDVNSLEPQKYNVFKEELNKSPFIISCGGASDVPPTLAGASGNVPKKNYPNEFVTMYLLSVDYDFIETMGLNLKEGRGFRREFGTDSSEALVINEAAAKEIGLNSGDTFLNKKVIGVAENFIQRSIHSKVPPFQLKIGKTKYIRELAIRYLPGKEKQVVKFVHSTWNTFAQGKNINYYFMDEKFDEVYENDYNFASLINTSTGLAMLIACLGLFGFTVFSTQQRIKEIGIRRILGASMWDVLKLFFSQYIALIITASVVGLTIGNYFVNQWLSGFAYKIDIEFHYFLVTLVIAISIILCTISAYVIKTVVANPVDSLRYE